MQHQCHYNVIHYRSCHTDITNVPTGTLRLPWLRFSHAFSSVVRQMPGYNSQKMGHGSHSSQLGDNFYVISLSLILVWPIWVWIPESLPTKVVNHVVLCIVCVKMCMVLLPLGGKPIAVNKYININININGRTHCMHVI